MRSLASNKNGQSLQLRICLNIDRFFNRISKFNAQLMNQE